MTWGRFTGGGSRRGVRNRCTERRFRVLDQAFEAIGGEEALADWARANPSDFYPIYLRVRANEHGVVIEAPRERAPTATELSTWSDAEVSDFLTVNLDVPPDQQQAALDELRRRADAYTPPAPLPAAIAADPHPDTASEPIAAPCVLRGAAGGISETTLGGSSGEPETAPATPQPETCYPLPGGEPVYIPNIGRPLNDPVAAQRRAENEARVELENERQRAAARERERLIAERGEL